MPAYEEDQMEEEQAWADHGMIFSMQCLCGEYSYSLCRHKCNPLQTHIPELVVRALRTKKTQKQHKAQVYARQNETSYLLHGPRFCVPRLGK
jgi:hypothetical protein